MRIYSTLLISWTLISSLSACGPSSKPELPSSETTRITVTGSSTIAPLAAELAKKFETEHPEFRIDVQTGGSSRGISDVRSSIAHIGMVSRALYESESDLNHHLIARDGVTIIAHGKNPVKNLSRQQIIDIYTGKIRNWSMVGGDDKPVTVVHKAEGRSTLEVFLAYTKLKNTQIKADSIIGDNQQGLKLVANNPNAIAYVSIGAAEYDAAHGLSIKLIDLDGIEASTQNVRNGRFPITRDLNFVTKGNPSEATQRFLEFAVREYNQNIVEGLGFVAADAP
ncbi:MAG: phosphate ABC transporter substrate-binding protein [Gammaproteobacteria bacterium]|nr:phosphate ABC transporter substrate-binding protein [Gammaproteobacteria bacterium]MDH5693349.1 phosphate ABC transporter substrate-binding protein [Gammaproteobacteria bacterium]